MIKRFAALIGLTLLFLTPTTFLTVQAAASPRIYLADTPKQAICNGIGLTNPDGTCGDSGAQVSSVLAVIINLLSVVIGIVAVIMIIVAGFKFITSGGDSNKVGSAKNTIVYALIGLAIVVLAQGIVRFVLANLK